jgi:hypothetical protein
LYHYAQAECRRLTAENRQLTAALEKFQRGAGNGGGGGGGGGGDGGDAAKSAKPAKAGKPLIKRGVRAR